MSQMYELRIVASGEVRDADGNLIRSEPVEAVAVVDEETARKVLAENREPKENPS